jgi:hypothetical protein
MILGSSAEVTCPNVFLPEKFLVPHDQESLIQFGLLTRQRFRLLLCHFGVGVLIASAE